MKTNHKFKITILLAIILAVALPTVVFAGHGGSTSDELTVVGHLDFGQPGENITDVWAYGNYAYLGAFDDIVCSLDLTGVRVVDISNPANPVQVAFIEAQPGTRNNDVKVEHIETKTFSGEILVISNEQCGSPFLPRFNANGVGAPPGQGGISIWDVTDPTKPHAMKQNFLNNSIHNTFIWQDGDNAYLIAVDDISFSDVIIVDITKPQSPKVITRTGAPDWPSDIADEIAGAGLFLHDVWVQDGIAYLSYWDAGLVLLDVSDPANPTFMGDSTYPNPDVVSGLPPAGNGHVAAPTAGGDIVILGDEDFSKSNNTLTTNVGSFQFGIALYGPDPIATFPAGDIVWTGGDGCTIASVPPADAGDPDPQIALIQRGACFFSQKAENAEAQGYDAYIVANSEAGGDGLFNMSPGTVGRWNIPGIFVGNTDGESMKAAGTTTSGIVAIFDGEGFMRVLDVSDPANIVQVGHFATEGVFSLGLISGDRTAHNVIVRGDRSYWSWYAEGMRVVDFSDCDAGDGFEGCTPTEVAHFVDNANVSNFWGVYLLDHPMATPISWAATAAPACGYSNFPKQ